jgi:hypothetical protein
MMLLKTDCRLKGDVLLAKDLLMSVCQSQRRNLGRSVNKDRKDRGEIVKRGRKSKTAKIQCCPFKYLSNL